MFIFEEVGCYNVDVFFGGVLVFGSFFIFKVEKLVDVDKIKCEFKVDKEFVVDEEFVYVVDVWLVEFVFGEIFDGLFNGVFFIFLGEKELVCIKDNKDGIYDVVCVLKEFGFYELVLDYNGVLLSGSLYKFVVVEGGVDKVKVYGKGILKF